MPKINYMTNYKDKNQLNLAFKNEWSDIVLYGFLKIYLPPKNKTKVEILSKILQFYKTLEEFSEIWCVMWPVGGSTALSPSPVSPYQRRSDCFPSSEHFDRRRARVWRERRAWTHPSFMKALQKHMWLHQADGRSCLFYTHLWEILPSAWDEALTLVNI